ncbi:hypothetical protein BM449_03200 [Synechococcus sp. SynAce01]|nr:hypothetical protein BM449_03200 [Synechococcus sp. SynAce01]
MGTAQNWDLRANLSAYDALSVSLAEQLEVRLITADPRNGRFQGEEGQPPRLVTKQSSLIRYRQIGGG